MATQIIPWISVLVVIGFLVSVMVAAARWDSRESNQHRVLRIPTHLGFRGEDDWFAPYLNEPTNTYSPEPTQGTYTDHLAHLQTTLEHNLADLHPAPTVWANKPFPILTDEEADAAWQLFLEGNAQIESLIEGRLITL